MKNKHLLLVFFFLIFSSCKKESVDTIVGNWEVTQRSMYSYELSGSQAFDAKILKDIEPGYYTLAFSADGSYISDNTTYIKAVSKGTYFIDKNTITLIQNTVNDEPKPLTFEYNISISDKNTKVTLSATTFIIKMNRSK